MEWIDVKQHLHATERQLMSICRLDGEPLMSLVWKSHCLNNHIVATKRRWWPSTWRGCTETVSWCLTLYLKSLNMFILVLILKWDSSQSSDLSGEGSYVTFLTNTSLYLICVTVIVKIPSLHLPDQVFIATEVSWVYKQSYHSAVNFDIPQRVKTLCRNGIAVVSS